MTPRPTVGCATRCFARSWRALLGGLLGVALGCGPVGEGAQPGGETGSPSTVGAAHSPAPSGEDARGAAATASLVGRLLDDVVPDSALFGSWVVHPVERRIGMRYVVLEGAHLLLADTLEGHDGDRARWRIRQVQPVAAPAAGEGYVASCALPGADAADGTVVARVTLSPDEALTPIHAAWRLDPSTWRFAPFPTDSLACYNEGGGP